MLNQSRKLLGLGILLAVTQLVQAQQAADPAAPVAATDSGPPLALEPVPFLHVDPTTWLIVGPEADLPENAWLNMPDQIEARRLAALELTDPPEFYRQFPRTPEEEQALVDSMDRILNPEKYVAWLDAQKTPEQRQYEADAQFAILHPLEYARMLAQQQAAAVPPQDPNPLQSEDAFPPPPPGQPPAPADAAAPAPAATVNDNSATPLPANPNQN